MPNKAFLGLFVDRNPKERLVERFRDAVFVMMLALNSKGDRIEAKKYSRMESRVLDIIRIVREHCDEKLDVLAVIYKDLGTDMCNGQK